MPKKQSTAAKRARSAARAGAKYTTALRHLPPCLPLFEAVTDDEQLLVDHLGALAAEGRSIPVRQVMPEPAVIEAQHRSRADGRPVRGQRWASVQAAVDGYVLRETQYGPNRSGYTATARGPRVPVPVRGADGTVSVVAMPEWARLEGFEWVWVHTGWPVERPGRIVDPPQDLFPAPDLRWQVAVWLDLGHEGKVLGEDYVGSASGWQTVGWCTSREDAQTIARAYTAHRDHYARADVIEHGTDNGIVSVTRDTYLPAPDAPERPRSTAAPGPRPASPDRSELLEPAWSTAHDNPPSSSLVVWTGTRWRTLVWTDWQTRNIATLLGIGAGGPYEWAEDWGPRHPDRDLHDWTQEGRELSARLPEPSYAERSRLIDADRQAVEEALIEALAIRGGLTRQQAAARLEQGGQAYGDFLAVGQAVISRALHTARRALPEGPERTAVRHALDDLTDRHVLPADAQSIADAQLDSEIESTRAPGVTAWCRRAVAEYIHPATDPAAAGVDGFTPAA